MIKKKLHHYHLSTMHSRCRGGKFHIILTMLKVLIDCEKNDRKLLSFAKSGCMLSLKFK